MDPDNVDNVANVCVLHSLKNERSMQHIAIMKLNIKLRFGLSGTIVQNNYRELWCVLEIVRPNNPDNPDNPDNPY